MPEITLNLHMHTTYSDGTGSHASIAQAALNAGIDAVIVTDHNVLVQDVEGYKLDGKRKVLFMVGEEIHNPTRHPQKSHMLVFNTGREMARFGGDPQRLIDQVRRHKGLSFIAHPIDPALPLFGEDDISWEDWQVNGFTGLELWNGLSELKTVIKGRFSALFYALFPSFVAHGPLPGVLKIWDDLLVTRRQPIVAVCGSDAHALHMHAGPMTRIIFPYEFHFRSINNHVLLDNELTGDFHLDRQAVFAALAKGHVFVGYDLPHPTHGFRFTAQGSEGTANMGDIIPAGHGVTLQAKLPLPVECILLRDGQQVKHWDEQSVCTYITKQPGVYRVECYIQFRGKRRGWIFSNPIYVRE